MKAVILALVSAYALGLDAWPPQTTPYIAASVEAIREIGRQQNFAVDAR